MAVATVVLSPPAVSGYIKGKWTSASSVGATNIQCGFIPSVIIWWNVSDKDQVGVWSNGMAAGLGLKMDTAAAAISANGITAYTGAAAASGDTGTPAQAVPGFTIGTDASVQEASKVWEFIAFR
jgi:hypothetical protein